MNPEPKPGTTPATMRPHVVAAVLVYCWDALIASQGLVGGVVALVMVLVGVAGVVGGLAGDRRRVRRGLTTVAIYAAMMAGIVGTIAFNNRLARARAETVIAALNTYRADRGEFPGRLEDLVPRYLPAVPAAKWVLVFRHFEYYRSDDGYGALFYYQFPPFGRPTYSLKTGKWGYID